MGSIVKHLHLPLKDAWDFTLLEFYAVLGKDEEENNAKPFDEDEQAQIDAMIAKIKASNPAQ